MTNTPKNLLNYIHVIVGAWRDDPRDDAQLLAQFVEARDEGAFTALLWRHGLLVWRTCTRVLGDGPDAEDAFQTTFLALARKAGQLRAATLPGWLHRVARQAALDTEAKSRKRQSFEHHLQAITQLASEQRTSHADLYAVLDEELTSLPERLRIPLVLRYLEGKTLEEVARIVGCCRRVLGRRLARGEALLRERLERRGLEVGIASVGTLLGSTATTSAIPARLIGSTARAVVAFRSGALTGGTAEAARAVLGSLPSSLGTTIMRKSLWIVLACCVGLTGAGLVTCRGLSARLDGPAVGDPEATQAAGRLARGKRAAVRVDCQGDPLPKRALARLGTTRLRHSGSVESVVFSPDGKIVASGGGQDGAVRLWETATGKGIRTLKGHKGGVWAVAFSPDGKTVATGGKDWMGRLWETATGKEIRILEGHKGRITSVVFSPDGKIVATGGKDDRLVRLWEVATGKEIRTLRGHKEEIFAVAFSPDGKTVASGGKGKTVRLWEATTGKAVHTLKGPEERWVCCAVVFLPDGKTVASADIRGVVRLWEAATGKEIRTVQGKGFVPYVTFSPDGKAVAMGNNDGTVYLREAATGKEIHTLQGSEMSVNNVAFSPDGKTVATAEHGGVVRLWETATGKPIRMSEGHEGSAFTIAFASDDKTVATAGLDGTVRLWQMATGKPIRTLQGHKGWVFSVAFSPDGKTVATGGWDGVVRLWEATTGKEICTLKGNKGEVIAVTFSPDGKTVASVGKGDGVVLLWETDTGKKIGTLQGRTWITVVSFSPDGKTVATGGEGGIVSLWEVATGEEIRTFEGHKGRVFMVAFSPDGRIVASGGLEGTVRLSEVATGKEIRTLQGHQGGQIFAAAFSHDGRTLAVASGDCVQLWDLFSGKAFPPLAGHRGPVLGVSFSFDGKVLASVSEDTTGLIWDLTSGAARPATKPVPDAQEALWADLASPDTSRAWRAVWTLAATPAQSVPLLRDRLRPASAPDPKRLARLTRLIADLDADDFKMRERAQRELEEASSDAEPALRKALEGKPSLELRRRLEQLLKAQSKRSFSGEVLRSLRAVAVLEQVGTPKAREILKTLAAGPPKYRLTQDAQAALGRLDGVRRP